MINFRYHIVSLMAVFMALPSASRSGVSLGPSVDQGLQQQAAQDRKQVSELRAELDRRNALDEYREAYEQQVGDVVIEGALSGVPVALVEHARRPGLGRPGGQRRGRDRRRDGGPRGRGPTRMRSIPPRRRRWRTHSKPGAGRSDSTTRCHPRPRSERRWPGRSPSRQAEDRDQLALDVADALDGGGLVSINRGSTAQAQLVIVIPAEATDPAAEQRPAHRPCPVLCRPERPGRGRAGRPEQPGDRGHRRPGGPIGRRGRRCAEHGRRRRPDQRREHHASWPVRSSCSAGQGGTTARWPAPTPRCRRCRCADGGPADPCRRLPRPRQPPSPPPRTVGPWPG